MAFSKFLTNYLLINGMHAVTYAASIKTDEPAGVVIQVSDQYPPLVSAEGAIYSDEYKLLFNRATKFTSYVLNVYHCLGILMSIYGPEGYSGPEIIACTCL